jgi:hypothetical protein
MQKKRTAGLPVGIVLAVAAGFALAEPAAAAEIWVAPAHFLAPALDSFPWATTGAGYAGFAFGVPDDFSALTSVTVVLIPRSDLTGSFDAYGSVKREGQVASERLLSTLGIPATLQAGRLDEVDVTALLAGQLTPISAGRDHVSVFFLSPTSPGLEDATVVGLRFTYVADRLGADAIQTGAVTAEKLASGAVTTGKIENGAVTNAKLADGSVGTNKVVDNSLTSADIQDGSIGAQDVNTNQLQQRVSAPCPFGQSIREIARSGAVTCETDSYGLAGYFRTLHYETCDAHTACKRSIDCGASKLAMGGGAFLAEPFDFEVFNKFDIVESFPTEDSEWAITVVNSNDRQVQVGLYVTCSYGSSFFESAGASATSRTGAATVRQREDRRRGGS